MGRFSNENFFTERDSQGKRINSTLGKTSRIREDNKKPEVKITSEVSWGLNGGKNFEESVGTERWGREEKHDYCGKKKKNLRRASRLKFQGSISSEGYFTIIGV